MVLAAVEAFDGRRHAGLTTGDLLSNPLSTVERRIGKGQESCDGAESKTETTDGDDENAQVAQVIEVVHVLTRFVVSVKSVSRLEDGRFVGTDEVCSGATPRGTA